MKKSLILLAKIGIPVAILAYLFRGAWHHHALGALLAQWREFGFDWGFLAAAWACCAAAVLITLVRWWYLVRTLDMPLSPNDALRIGLVGYLFNLAPMGILGGDLLKGIMLARRQRERRAQAFATVAVDRVIGLYMLFVVASAAILLTDFLHHSVPKIRFISLATLAVTAAATAGMVVLFITGATQGKISRSLGNVRYVGPPLEHLIEAMRMYRQRVPALLVAAVMSVGVHTLFTLGIYLITVGLYEKVYDLSLRAEFIVSPLSAATGIIPVVAGPFEGVLTFLYGEVFRMTQSEGLVVALGYRLICILIAAVGVCYYLGSRGEVAQVIQEAEQQQHAEQPPQSVVA